MSVLNRKLETCNEWHCSICQLFKTTLVVPGSEHALRGEPRLMTWHWTEQHLYQTRRIKGIEHTSCTVQDTVGNFHWSVFSTQNLERALNMSFFSCTSSTALVRKVRTFLKPACRLTLEVPVHTTEKESTINKDTEGSEGRYSMVFA